jgi:UDP-glucose 4-epimerase
MGYVVTGGSGYIGTRLIERLTERGDTDGITIWDVRPPRVFRPGVSYEQVDVRDRARVREQMHAQRPQTVIHLAFILNPIHDEHTMYEIDVGGTQNVLEAAAESGVEQVLVTSSATAYGAFPDNPVPLTEDDPVRGVPDFEYARDKAESDRLCQLWALQHPERTMTIVRPCIVLGPNVDNFIVRLWTDQPFQPDFGLPETPFQFVHEDDLVEALVLLLEGRHGGAFNIAGDGYVKASELAERIGMKRRRVPLKLYRRLAAAMWKLRQSETPAGQIQFAIHPWVTSNEKLKQAAGWAPKHTSMETFEITMRSRGLLDEGATPSVGTPKIGTPAGV